MPAPLARTPEYQSLLADLKKRIAEAQVRAGLAVNRELVLLYWSIGRDILARQEAEGWGAKVIDSLAQDLRRSFLKCKACRPVISSTCEPSLRLGRTRQLCNGLLHKYRGATT